MKLILTDYIASLKEERELDSLIEEVLREYDFEIVFSPKKGERQYGVDIYAVGVDWSDGIRKIFLITVKQGNFDRKNWESGPQSLQPSLVNIITVFIRNNILPEHLNLPIKIIVAHNGINDPGIQQNWKGFAEMYTNYEFVIWQLETLVGLVQDKLINENVFSDNGKRLLRKIIISLSNPDYDFNDYKDVLNEINGLIDFQEKSKKHNLKQLRKINLINTIISSYCDLENDLRLALKASEITALFIWKIINENEKHIDNEYFGEFIKTLITRKDIHLKYLKKILPICLIKDGLSKNSRDSVTYCFAVYEHLGFLALTGLEFLQLGELFASTDSNTSAILKDYSIECMFGIANIFNNNIIAFNPRSDDEIIEIVLCFLLFYKLERFEDIRVLLIRFSNEIAHGKIFSNIAPVFSNNVDQIFNLDVDFEKRTDFKYDSSSLLIILAEWAIVINDSQVYNLYYQLKEEVFKDIDLILWFPDVETDKLLYTNRTLPNTGYSLSNIKLLENFEEFKQLTLVDYINNCNELEFLFLQENLWIVGLVASRHYRTYIFPYYWRSLIKNKSSLMK